MVISVSVKASRKDASGAVARAFRQYLKDGADSGFAESQQRVSVDRGTLLQSGFPPEWDGDTLRWGYRANHAWAMEEGTDPFWPPAQPLVEWADRVLGDPGLGYAVQHTIAKYGLDAQPYARPGAEKQAAWYRAMPFERYLKRELNQ